MKRRIEAKRSEVTVVIHEPSIDTDDGPSRELEELYAFAEEQGYFIYEFTMGGMYNAAVGNQSVLDENNITVEQLAEHGILAFMNISVPGAGPRRELAVQRALYQWHAHEQKRAEEIPGGTRTLWATVRDGNTLAKVTIPDTPDQELAAEVEVFVDGESEPVKKYSIAMADAPVFEVSQRDEKTIIDGVLRELVMRDSVGVSTQPLVLGKGIDLEIPFGRI
jgi:hypothetical protein